MVAVKVVYQWDWSLRLARLILFVFVHRSAGCDGISNGKCRPKIVKRVIVLGGQPFRRFGSLS